MAKKLFVISIFKNETKKLISKDKKTRLSIRNSENRFFILKSILQNFNFFVLIRWNAFLILNNLKQNLKTSLINRCLQTVNKK